jgi:hypothetical protein
MHAEILEHIQAFESEIVVRVFKVLLENVSKVFSFGNDFSLLSQTLGSAKDENEITRFVCIVDTVISVIGSDDLTDLEMVCG